MRPTRTIFFYGKRGSNLNLTMVNKGCKPQKAFTIYPNTICLI
jgi:hypothetical protein